MQTATQVEEDKEHVLSSATVFGPQQNTDLRQEGVKKRKGGLLAQGYEDFLALPVPMRDAQMIYAALGSLKRIEANEGNDAFVQTLDGLMDRLKDSHNTVVTEWGAGQDDLIRDSEEDGSAPPGQEPHREAPPQERAELLRWLYGAQNEEQIDDAVAAADRWLVEAPHDEEVRLTRDQAIHRRSGAPPL